MATAPRTRTRAPGAQSAPQPAAKEAPKTAPAGNGPPRPSSSGFLRDLHKAAAKQYGEGTMAPADIAFNYMRHIPMGHLIGDLATLGGLPEGQSAMYIGLPGAGKTTQAMRNVAQAQLKYPNHHAMWVDAEGTFDPIWARHHGVDLSRLHLIQTVVGEDAVDLMQTAVVGAEELCFLVLDSAPMLTPQKEYEDSVGDVQVALSARLLGRMSSHLQAADRERKTKGWIPVTKIFINQWRHTIGGMPKFDNKVMPGGKQFIHACSTWVDFRSKVITDKDEADNVVSSVVEHVLTMKRSKGASSIRAGEYAVVVGADHRLPIGSYDESGTILAQAKKIGLWEGAGRAQKFTQYPDIFPTMDAGKAWLDDNPEAALEIKRAILSHQRHKVGMPMIPPDGFLLRW